METIPFKLLADLAMDPGHGWSIGSFGAIGEFVRDADEPAQITRAADRIEVVTPRGALRIAPSAPMTALAWDGLNADGDTWSQALAVCVTVPDGAPRVVGSLGLDAEAARPEDRDAHLFDVGVGLGDVRLCVRTRDEGLVAALEAAVGRDYLAADLAAETLRAQPHRVLLSSVGRIEVFQPIPPPDGKSPEGPHTHLLPKLIAKARGHGSNVPIPEGWQSALNLHPRSPWRTPLGERTPFDPAADAVFNSLLARYGLSADAAIAADLAATIGSGARPEDAEWPDTRRGRTKARITLRRLAAAGDERARPWRALHDRAPIEDDEPSSGEEAAG